jgi:hypothetical protein
MRVIWNTLLNGIGLFFLIVGIGSARAGQIEEDFLRKRIENFSKLASEKQANDRTGPAAEAALTGSVGIKPPVTNDPHELDASEKAAGKPVPDTDPPLNLTDSAPETAPPRTGSVTAPPAGGAVAIPVNTGKPAQGGTAEPALVFPGK